METLIALTGMSVTVALTVSGIIDTWQWYYFPTAIVIAAAVRWLGYALSRLVE